MNLGDDSPIAIVGSGFVGGSLAIALSRAGFPIVACASRTFSSAEAIASKVEGCVASETIQGAVDLAKVVFITTPDDAIGPTAQSIQWNRGQAVVHCSGAASLDIFDGLTDEAVILGAFHPLQAFSSMETGAESISGITFGIEGGSDISSYLERMAFKLNANPIFLKPEDKALYHLTGVMMGNLLTEYVALSSYLWEHIGASRSEGLRALLPMMRQVATNLEQFGIPAAVAGPYVRGDVGTVFKHLEALKKKEPGLLAFYCELALAGFRFAEEKGTLDESARLEIRQILSEALETKRD